MSALYHGRDHSTARFDVASLPAGQLRVLLAHAASWRVCNRAPTAPELLSARIALNSAAAQMRALEAKGLLDSVWIGGKRARFTVRLTAEAWRQLGALVDREVA